MASDQTTVMVEGMTCANCAQSLTKHLTSEGYSDVDVNFAKGELVMSSDQSVDLERLSKEIGKAGFKYTGLKYEKQKGGMSSIEKKFLFTLPFTIPLLLHMIPGVPFVGDPLVQLVLSLPVVILGWWHFGRSAFFSLKTGVPNMDVLIFIGSTAAFAYSLTGTLLFWETEAAHTYMFFETAATIVTLVLLGNVLEHRSVKQTTTAITSLEKLQVGTAKRVSLQMGEQKVDEVEIEDIGVHDLIMLNTGDGIPADGELIQGDVSVNESMITGESIPVSKIVGDPVTGGTIVEDGNALMRVTGVGESTVLSGIIDMVNRAQRTKPAIQKLADRISAVFVPVVLAVSALTFLLSYFAFSIPLEASIMSSVAVLVISCPCAMGLATPTAVMVGLGRSAQEGVLFKGADSMERLASVKTVVFDKTGTLTTGQINVSLMDFDPSFDEREVNSATLGLEMHSSHPIAKSVTEILKANTIAKALQNVEEQKGRGMKGVDADGNTWMIGSSVTINADRKGDLFLTKNGEWVASFVLKDTIRKDAKAMIAFLHRNDIETVILSGDSEAKTNEVAAELGIKIKHWQKSPEQKLEILKEYVAAAPTAMVGDGINDAPALTQATVGISLSQGTQVAIEAADVVLLEKYGIGQLERAIRMGEETVRTIRQNLFWAFFYNVIAIPIAAVGLLNPMVAAFSMAFSDVVVIGNSIRFKFRSVK
ncbi:MAG: Cu+-exporting ATPase [Granulosicoccus sp.]|jgi:Cu+-exporting ATPase